MGLYVDSIDIEILNNVKRVSMDIPEKEKSTGYDHPNKRPTIYRGKDVLFKSFLKDLDFPVHSETMRYSSVQEDLRRDEAIKDGFTGNLWNTVDPCHRHVFVCQNFDQDAPVTEDLKNDSLPEFLAAGFRSHANKDSVKTRMALCEVPHGSDDSSVGDVFVFPDMVKYRGLTNAEANNFAKDLLEKGLGWVTKQMYPLKGSYVFVSSHGCLENGWCGCVQKLIARFHQEIKDRQLDHEIFVSPCTFPGAQKFPGGVTIFSRNPVSKKVTGHWYGCVVPSDVPALLEQHIGQGKLINVLWRGEMLDFPTGFPTEDSQEVVKEKCQAIVCTGDKDKGQEIVCSTSSSGSTMKKSKKRKDRKEGDDDLQIRKRQYKEDMLTFGSEFGSENIEVTKVGTASSCETLLVNYKGEILAVSTIDSKEVAKEKPKKQKKGVLAVKSPSELGFLTVKSE